MSTGVLPRNMYQHDDEVVYLVLVLFPLHPMSFFFRQEASGLFSKDVLSLLTNFLRVTSRPLEICFFSELHAENMLMKLETKEAWLIG